MTHIVVLGAGLGGIPMAYEMKDLCKKADKVTVISNTDTFHFVPSNPWVGVGWSKREDIEVYLPKVFKKRKIEFTSVGAKRVHPKDNYVELEDGTKIDYDYLVVATGPRLNFEAIEGLGPNGHTQSVCHVDHAVTSTGVWNEFVKNPAPIVVGAVQGASCYGPAYEYAFIMEADLRKRKMRDQVPMTYVTSEPYIGHLGLGGVGDSKHMMESLFRTKSIKWICNAQVDKVEKGKMYVTEFNEDKTEKKKHELDFGYSMMLPSFEGVEAVQGIKDLVNPKGFVHIDEHQCNPTFRNIFAIGVCVAIAPLEDTPVPVGVPKTGYMIESMVTATAHNIKSLMDGEEMHEKGTWNAICLADMGDTGAAFVALPQIPPRNVNWVSHGRWVHWAKIGFEKYFLYKVRSGNSAPIIERLTLRLFGIKRRK